MIAAGAAGEEIMEVFSFEELASADLRVDAIYQGGRSGHKGDDPFPHLLTVSNMGGFRYRGKLEKDALELLVLITSMSDPDWPDSLDRETGVFTYFGDNKSPGRELHGTPRRGNELLRRIFANAHSGLDGRRCVPPILLFANTGEGRDVIFLGLAVPGIADQRAPEDLVAIWKVASGKRFQNYRARFSVLNVPIVSRAWLEDIIERRALHTANAPAVWTSWVESGKCEVLRASRSLEHRTKAEQLPTTKEELSILRAVHEYFVGRPHDFEHCAAAIARMLLPNVSTLDVTRPSRDGGRDAIGQLKLGDGPGAILVDFALEAKCYGIANSVGVREMSRLISRLRHRQFGVLVTTSFVDAQAYREIKEDRHPIIVVAAIDIVRLLRANGHGEAETVLAWLEVNFSAK
jgi:hypothetical protein